MFFCRENPSKFEETVNQLAVDELKAKQQAKEDAEKLKADAIKKAKEDREKAITVCFDQFTRVVVGFRRYNESRPSCR